MDSEQLQFNNAEVKAAAQAYLEQGLAIVPFMMGADGKKRPAIIEWGKWQTRRQTREEFDALNIERYTMFGVVCGTKTNSGNYFCVIDRDIKDTKLTDEIKDKTLIAIKLMRLTKMEKTRSGGQHLPYYSRMQIKGQKLNDVGLELLALGQLCVMAPSKGYSQELSSDIIATVDNLQDEFTSAIEKAGLIAKTQKPEIPKQSQEKPAHTPLRPCFNKLMEKQHLEHDEKVALTYELYYCGNSEDEIKKIFKDNRAWEPPPEQSYSETKTNSQISYIMAKVREGNYRYARNTLKTKHICYPECLLIDEKDCRKLQEDVENKDSDYTDFCDKKGGFKPALVAQWLKKNYCFKTDKKTQLLYYYDEETGCWGENGEVFVQELLAEILGSENRQSYFSNVLHDLKGITFQDIRFSKKLACINGLLDLENAEPQLSPFSPEEMPFHSIPVKYSQEAKCPNWEQFVKQVLSPEDIPTLQEWSGYLLLPDYRFHKLLWVHGEGRNGKGVWQRTMEAILGEDNVSSIGLEEFDGNHRFALRQLYGKLFNPCSEPPTNRILQTPLLKKATGQDTIEAEIKCKQTRMKFRNCAKITVIANKFPKNNDTSTAFKERRLFIKFPNEFTGNNQIQNLEDNWLNNPQEKSGILNWVIEGLKRLLSQGHFSESKTQQETEIEFQRASDTIGAFLTELGVFNRNYVTTRTEAYEGYKNYCDVMGLETENEKRFTARLKETAKISVTTISKPKRERAWKGLAIKQLNDDGSVTPVADVTGAKLPQILSIETKQSGEGVTIVTPATTYSKRYCYDECKNFCKCSCTATNPFDRPDNAEIPLKCPGYKFVNDDEEET